MIQVIYNLMCLYNEFKPLRGYLGRDNKYFDKFRKFKTAETATEFCVVNECEFLTEVLEECYALKYDEQPKYTKIKFLLQKSLLQENMAPGGRYYYKKPNVQDNVNLA